jgi:hypothetical protein
VEGFDLGSGSELPRLMPKRPDIHLRPRHPPIGAILNAAQLPHEVLPSMLIFAMARTPQCENVIGRWRAHRRDFKSTGAAKTTTLL